MSAGSLDRIATGADAGEAVLYVINLCASTSPLALVHPSDPALKRHTFFVTRHREDGRERFRLHMGYFPTQEEAEALLAAVRDIYPAAWAGPAPSSGAPRRARPAAAVPAAPPPAVAAPAPAPVPTPAPAPAAATPVPAGVAPDTSATLNRMSNVRAVIAQLSDESLPKAAAVAPPARVAPPATATQPAQVAVPASPVPKAPAAPPVLQAATVTTSPPAARDLAPSAPLTPAQTLTLLETGSRLPVMTSPQAAAATPVAAVTAAPISPTTPAAPHLRARAPEIPEIPEGSSVRVVTPEDTQTLRDIKLDAERNAPPCFAVQLLWAVAPIDAAAHPHLAIFDAYTLYNVEGSRHGRRWYGLRLGFFKDPNAASQVAYYVRSEYPTVAVVPVAQKERDNAAGPGEGARKPAMPAPQKPQQQTEIERKGLEGFELLEDDRPRPAKRDVDDVPAVANAAERKVAEATKAPPGKAAAGAKPVLNTKPAAKPPGKPTGKRVVVRKPESKGRVTPGATVPLDETFELLGASTLTIDEGREVINDTAVRRAPEKKPEGSGGRLSRLLTRLGGR